MIISLLNWLYIYFIIFPLGSIFYKFISKYNIEYQNNGNFIQKIFLGLAITFAINCLFCFFYPISLAANIFLIIASSICILIDKSILTKCIAPFKKLDTLATILFGLVFFICILESVDVGHHHDEYLYYQPTIRWIQDYKVIPGLANLHGKFGFGSSWFILAAFFNMSGFGINFLNEINGFLVLAVCLYNLQFLRNLYTKNTYPKLSDFISVATVPFIFIVYFKYISCASPDAASSIMVWVLLTELVRKYEQGTLFKIDTTAIVLVIVSCFVFTMKLTNFAIVLVGIFYWIILILQKRYKIFALVSIFCLLIIAPWLARNVMQTGYLIYPLTSIDLFEVDWKVPVDKLQNTTPEYYCFSANEERKITLFHSRGLREGNLDETLALPFSYWFSNWVKIFEKVDFLIIPLCLISLFFIASYAIFQFRYFNTKRDEIMLILLVLSVHIIGLAVWFNNGPSPRYIYSLLCFPFIIVSAWSLSILYKSYSRHNFKITIGLLLFLGTTSASFFFSYIPPNYILKEHIPRLYKPPGFFYPETYFVYVNSDSGKKINVSFDFDGRCGFNNPPCARFLNPNLDFRGKSISDGFRVNKQAFSFEYHTQRELDIKKIRNSLDRYYKDNGSYPIASQMVNDNRNTAWIPQLVPVYLQGLPIDPRIDTNISNKYYYQSDGKEFKLISHNAPNMEFIIERFPELVDPKRPNWAFGFWTKGAIDW